jgi:bifunctional DNase/RNase
MKKIELEIIALSHSITQTQSYAVVLGEVNGLRRLPIVIGGFEAQAIAVALENMKPRLTHDLMKNFMNAFAVNLQEIVISDLQEGIFLVSWFVIQTMILLKLIVELAML